MDLIMQKWISGDTQEVVFRSATDKVAEFADEIERQGIYEVVEYQKSGNCILMTLREVGKSLHVGVDYILKNILKKY